MKCYKCNKDKELEEFSKNSNRPNGYNSQCKDCHKEYRRNHYLNNKQKYIDKASIYRKEFKIWFKEYKSTLKCNKCNESRWWVLDFHHKSPDKKDKEIAKLVQHCSKKRIMKEINECEVLCANCHRDLHYNPKNKIAT